MKKLLTILALTATSFAGKLTAQDEEMKVLWAAWKENHAKDYNEDEEPTRFAIFAENYNKIVDHNAAGNSTVTLGLNKFADLTGDEFKYKYASGHTPSGDEGNFPEPENKRFLANLPASWDWRTKGAITPVKNQKQCNGCWSFATANQLEALHFIKTGVLENFSEQQLLDCDHTSHGCRSGHMSTSLNWAAEYGVELLSNYPLSENVEVGTCKYNAAKAQKVNKGRADVASKNPNALLAAIVNQPVSVAIEANQSVFQFYKSGVITAGCGANTDHAVSAIGYATVNGHQAFLVKNSWGTGWGENGYFYISTSGSANGGLGVCGILSFPCYPTA